MFSKHAYQQVKMLWFYLVPRKNSEILWPAKFSARTVARGSSVPYMAVTVQCCTSASFRNYKECSTLGLSDERFCKALYTERGVYGKRCIRKEVYTERGDSSLKAYKCIWLHSNLANVELNTVDYRYNELALSEFMRITNWIPFLFHVFITLWL